MGWVMNGMCWMLIEENFQATVLNPGTGSGTGSGMDSGMGLWAGALELVGMGGWKPPPASA